jgi:RNA polymerase sigma factor (TIGR02999 family)
MRIAPPTPPAGEVTTLLQAWRDGDEAARDRLIPVVYDELRRRARRHLEHERPGHTLGPTGLVHETYLRLCEQNQPSRNRAQFFAIASRLMRRILVDHARARVAAKRGRGLRLTLVEERTPAAAPPDLLDLDAALEELAALDEDQARLVELRYFGGLSLVETARALGWSHAKASREWAIARSWLYRRLTSARPAPGTPGPRPPR